MEIDMTREEAIKELRGFIGQLTEGCQEAIKVLIPELTESEDERARKWILEYLYDGLRKADEQFKEQFKSSIAWLEKQKEQTEELSTRLNGVMQEYVKAGKEEEEQEHRLKCYQLFWDALGDSEFFEQKDSPMPEDTVIFQKGVEEGRRLEREDMEKKRLPIIETYQRSWYTEGYYDGKLKKEPRWIIKTQGICTKFEENPKYGQSLEEEQKPAEKQDYSDLNGLERAIHRGFLSAGVENAPVTIIKETAQECLSQMKPAEWSDEENDKLNRIERLIVNANAHGNYLIGDKEAIELQHFIRSIVKPTTNPAEWSKEDENMMNNIINVLSTFVGTVECESNPSLSSSYPTYLREIDWLKSLKNRGNSLKSNTNSPSEWNDEDDVMLAHIIFLVKGNMGEDETIMWLKERFKNLGARPRWKPSEEQMGALNYAYCELFKRGDVDHNILGPFQNLIDTLSKL